MTAGKRGEETWTADWTEGWGRHAAYGRAGMFCAVSVATSVNAASVMLHLLAACSAPAALMVSSLVSVALHCGNTVFVSRILVLLVMVAECVTPAMLYVTVALPDSDGLNVLVRVAGADPAADSELEFEAPHAPWNPELVRV